MNNEATITGIFAELTAVLADARRDLALYTLVIGGLSAAGVLAGLTETTTGTINYGFSVDASDTTASALFDLVALVVSVVGTYLLLTRYLAVARAAARARQPLLALYRHGSCSRHSHWCSASMLLLVPGFIMLVRWSAASGFVIGAGEGVTASLGASWNATRGHSWTIFVRAV